MIKLWVKNNSKHNENERYNFSFSLNIPHSCLEQIRKKRNEDDKDEEGVGKDKSQHVPSYIVML